jgi:uncharacterized integral membrane protein
MARAKKASTRRKTTRKPSTKRASTKRSSSRKSSTRRPTTRKTSTKRPTTRKTSTRRTSASRKKRNTSSARKKGLLRTRKREKKILIIVAIIVVLVVAIALLQNTRYAKVDKERSKPIGEIASNAVEGKITSINVGPVRKAIRVKSFRTGKRYTFYVGWRTKFSPDRWPSTGERVKVYYVYDRGYLKATRVYIR